MCSDFHAKVEYTIDHVKCKLHVPRFKKQCDISIFKAEHFLYDIPAIDSAKLECLKSDAICGSHNLYSPLQLPARKAATT